METQKELYHWFIELEDDNRPVEHASVYSFTEEDAIQSFLDFFKEEYNYVPQKYNVSDECEVYLGNHLFYERYECVNPFDENTDFIDKWDYYQQVAEISEKTPFNVWSLYDDSSIVCGMYHIDVIGYHITTKPGKGGEHYAHYAGEVHT